MRKREPKSEIMKLREKSIGYVNEEIMILGVIA